MAFTDILSDISAFSNPFGAPAQGEWNLSPGIYTNSKKVQTVFYFEKGQGTKALNNGLDQTTDGGGRRVAIYEYPYIDGQKTDDLGRKGETYTLNIKFYGLNYQSALNTFVQNVVNDPGPGTLSHPTLSAIRGTIPVRFRDYEFVHRYDEWNAITIKAVFVEDNTNAITLLTQKPASPDSALRSALQTLTNTQSLISTGIFQVGALLKLPGSILSAMNQRLSSITGAFSRLLGQLAATFGSKAKSPLVTLAIQAAEIALGIPFLTVGSVETTPSSTVATTGNTQSSLYQLPPVYQVGYDPTTQAAISTQKENFVNSNQITPQQAVYAANQILALIAIAINEISGTENAVNISTVTNVSIISANGTGLLGNQGYSVMVQYRSLAVAIQNVVQQCIAVAQTQVTVYVVPYAMSLRMVAKLNGLSPDASTAIEALNPYVASVNRVPAGTQITVPAA